MEKVRYQVIGRLNRLQLRGQLTAARLKRLPSIRKKLRTRHLDVIQDLAGIRVILPTMRDVERVDEACRYGFSHIIDDTDNYIARPRISGYRSKHLKLEFTPGNQLEEICRGCRVELQIRTRFQHAWATAVEAVGLFRNEALKNNSGSPEWLRLFALMASEIARIERQPEVEDAPNHSERVRELRELNDELGAASYLDSISKAVEYTDRYYQAYRSEVYLISFDLNTHEVKIKGYTAAAGTREYHGLEMNEGLFDVVMVSSDKIDNLKHAFPNYFGDTKLFAKTLRQVIKGKDVPEFVLAPQATVRPGPREAADYSWLRRATRPQRPR